MTDDKKNRPFGDRKPRSGPRDGKQFEGGNRAKPFDKEGRPPRKDGPRFAKDAPVEEAPAGERIAKRLARAGVSSRREAEGLIADGRIAVNGKVLSSPAFNVMPQDKVTIDGKPIPEIERTRLWLFHKPAGLVTTNRDPEGRKTIFEALPEGMPRVITIGRLDINTEGLLLLTNDGGLARLLELPSTGWLRRYRVRVHGKVEQAQLDELKNGIAVDGVFYGSMEAVLDREQGANAWLTISLREGKNREVKNVMGALGLDVTRLIRISYGPFQLSDLPEGGVQELRGRLLRDQLGERLIEESGADFEAPILNEFTNSVVVKDKQPEAEPRDRRGWKPDAQERRDEALGRLDTRPVRNAPQEAAGGLYKRGRGPRDEARGDKPYGKRPPREGGREGPRDSAGPRDSKRSSPPRERARSNEERSEANRVPLGQERRGANVWMAPGARPEGAKAVASRVEREDRPARPARPSGDKPYEKRPYGDKPYAKGPREERGESRPTSKAPRDGDRPYSKAPRDGDKPFEKRPYGDRPFSKAPSADRPYSKGPREDRGESRPPRDGDRPFSKAPRGDRPFDKGPRDGKPGDKPRYGKPDGKPGARPASNGPRDGARSGPRSNGPGGGPARGPGKGPFKGPGRGPGRGER